MIEKVTERDTRPSADCHTSDLLLSRSRVSNKAALKKLLTLFKMKRLINCFLCERNKELYLFVEAQKGREREGEREER